MTITRINPDTMYKNPAFTQVATVIGAAKLVFVGGQNAVDATGKIVGKDIGTQTEQAFKNVITALAAAGATMHHVVKMTVYVVQGNSIQEGFAASARVDTGSAEPPTISVIIVSGLANPECLVEIEAVAAVG
jgi:enamine deaminase RidA (YjgF/YER057c/UK114 family)